MADPGLTGIGSRPRRFAAIGQPVSVCHQWSMTGTPSFSAAQLQRLGVEPLAGHEQRAEREQVVLRDLGAVRVDPLDRPQGGRRGEQRVHPLSAMTRQNAPASGVPTGLPSYITVVAPISSGA